MSTLATAENCLMCFSNQIYCHFLWYFCIVAIGTLVHGTMFKKIYNYLVLLTSRGIYLYLPSLLAELSFYWLAHITLNVDWKCIGIFLYENTACESSHDQVLEKRWLSQLRLCTCHFFFILELPNCICSFCIDLAVPMKEEQNQSTEVYWWEFKTEPVNNSTSFHSLDNHGLVMSWACMFYNMPVENISSSEYLLMVIDLISGMISFCTDLTSTVVMKALYIGLFNLIWLNVKMLSD